jgi:hypothetical protein
VLELDKFKFANGTMRTAYAVLDGLALSDLSTLDAWKNIHNDIIRYYRQGQWNYCEHALEGIMGKWNGQLDTFYVDLLARVQAMKETVVDSDWAGWIREPAVQNA